MPMQDEKLITSPEFIINTELGPAILTLNGANRATIRSIAPFNVCKCKYSVIYWLERESQIDVFDIQRERDPRTLKPIWNKLENRNLKLSRAGLMNTEAPPSGWLHVKRVLDRALYEWERNNGHEFRQAEAISLFTRLQRLNERENDIEIELALIAEKKSNLERKMATLVRTGAQLPTPDLNPL